jgi:hypothetical protein
MRTGKYWVRGIHKVRVIDGKIWYITDAALLHCDQHILKLWVQHQNLPFITTLRFFSALSLVYNNDNEVLVSEHVSLNAGQLQQ